MKHSQITPTTLTPPIIIEVNNLTLMDKANLQRALFKVGVIWGNGSRTVFNKALDTDTVSYIIKPNRRLYYSKYPVRAEGCKVFSPIEAIYALRYRIWLQDE